MKHHRKTIPTTAAVLALLAGAPAAALANPLLSGYGGPGLGSQAILGATLLGGSGGGGPTAAGPAGDGSLAEPSQGPGDRAGIATAAARTTTAAATTTARARTTTAAGSAGTADTVNPSGQRAPSSQAQTVSSFRLYPASERGLPQPSGALGLSGGDLLLILLTIVVLIATGVALSRLAPRPAAGRHGELKG